MMKSLLVANWKMHHGPESGCQFVREIQDAASSAQKTQCWIAAPALTIPSLVDVCHETPIRVGAQNVYSEASGAYTGELSVPLLAEVGATFAIVGHSERRHSFGETNELSVARAIGALAQDFTVVYCVGELADERERGRANDVISAQLSPLLSSFKKEWAKNLIIAYEPCWAIGSGAAASLDDIDAAHATVKELLKPQGIEVPLLYGGSFKRENAESILARPDVDGALIGGASLKAESYRALIDMSEAQV